MPPDGSDGAGSAGFAEPRPDIPTTPASSGADTPVSNTGQAAPVTTTPASTPSSATPTTTVTEVATSTPSVVAPLPEGGGMQLYIGLLLGAVALIAGAYGLAQLFQQKGEKTREDSDPCGDIKVELEIKERALDILKDKAAAAVGLADVKKLHDDIHTLTNTVQALQSKYQLCKLEFPDVHHVVLRFLSSEVPLVTARTLTSKEYVSKDEDVAEGDMVGLVDLESGKRFGTGRVTRVEERPGSDATLVTFEYRGRG